MNYTYTQVEVHENQINNNGEEGGKTQQPISRLGLLTNKPVAREVLDVLFSTLIVAPLVVLFWRGTFNTITHSAFQLSLIHI